MRERRQRGSRTTAHRFWIGLCSLWLVSALFHALAWNDAPLRRPDSLSYMEAARDLADFRLDALHDRPPGYPLLLAITGSTQTPRRALFFLQLFLHTFSTACLTALGLRLGVPRRLLFLFAVLASLPPSVAPAAYVLTETASEFTLAFAVGALMLWWSGGRSRWLVTAVLACTAAGFVRPTYIFVGPALAVVVFFLSERQETRPSLRIAAASLVVVPSVALTTFALFNQQRFDFPGVTPLFGFNLTTRTIDIVERLPESEAGLRDILISHRDRSLVEPRSDHTGTMSIWAAIPELQAATGVSRSQLSQKMLALNLQLVRQAPLHYLSTVLQAMGSYWTPTSPELANFGSRPLQLLWGLVLSGTLMLFGANVLFVGGMLCLAFLVPRFRTDLDQHRELVLGILFTFTIIFYSMLVSTLVETGDPRYRSPTDLLIWFSTLLGIVLCHRLRGRS